MEIRQSSPVFDIVQLALVKKHILLVDNLLATGSCQSMHHYLSMMEEKKEAEQDSLSAWFESFVDAVDNDERCWSTIQEALDEGEVNYLKQHVKWEDDDYTPLHYVAEEGDLEIVEELINNRNVPVNIKAGEINRTPLHFAASAGKLKVVKSLVEVHHADIDALDKEGASALHYAAAGGQEEVSKKVVKFLVEKGADPNKLVNNKFSVLALAINAGNIAVVQYLITSPATLIPTADSKKGKHLIKLAESLYEDTILKLLKEYYQPQNIAHNTCKTCCNVT